MDTCLAPLSGQCEWCCFKHGWRDNDFELVWLLLVYLEMVISSFLIGYFICLFFFLRGPNPTACGILVPQPGIRPVPPALEAQSLSHWTARKVPHSYHLKNMSVKMLTWLFKISIAESQHKLLF